MFIQSNYIARPHKKQGSGKLFALFFGHFTLELFYSENRYDTLFVEKTEDSDVDGQEGI